MKRKTAKETLADSFRELAEKKTVDRITVTDIAENCGYSTTTFYRQFRDKYDLMAWEYTQRIEEVIEHVSLNVSGWERACIGCAELFQEQRAYLKNLLLHTSGFNSFLQNMMQIHFERLKRMILYATGESQMDTEVEMYARTYCYGAVSLSCDWIMGKYDASEQELAKVLIHALPEPLHAYIMEP